MKTGENGNNGESIIRKIKNSNYLIKVLLFGEGYESKDFAFLSSSPKILTWLPYFNDLHTNK